jgi:hypothetical protein
MISCRGTLSAFSGTSERLDAGGLIRLGENVWRSRFKLTAENWDLTAAIFHIPFPKDFCHN